MDFIEKAKQVHGDKYDYSKVEYVNSHTKVCIICPIHGEFWQLPNNHLRGHGCMNCYNDKRGRTLVFTTDDFIRRAREMHGDKYDYSKVEYKNTYTKVCIICPEHGEYLQAPAYHLQGQGCPECGKIRVQEENNKRKEKSKKEFIQKALRIHGNKYDYTKVEYINAHSKIRIICPEHGEFLQRPNDHLSGYGCPKCKRSHLEKEIADFLNDNHINYETQKTFEWLKYRYNMYLDFYLPDYNIAIECQGEQHFKPVTFNRKLKVDEEKFRIIKERDKCKLQKCNEHGIMILYYTNIKNICICEFYENNLYFNIKDLYNNIMGYSRKMSEEHKRKISESRKGKKHTEETKKKISEAIKAKWDEVPKNF